MKNKSENPLAFPHVAEFIETGMSLRDYFAGQCLAGMLANPEFVKSAIKSKKYLEKEYGESIGFAASNQDLHAVACYGFADAMLKKREE
jgi:hypothetical protein